MAIVLDPSIGITNVDGTAASPANTGTDTNTGIFYGTDIVGISTGGSERVRVDASGNVGIGTTSPASSLAVDNGTITVTRYGSTGAVVCRSASGTQSSPTAISSSTQLGQIVFRGYDGSAYRNTGLITGSSDGAISSTSSPGFIQFSTVPSGSISLSERMRIASNGQMLLGTTTNSGRSPPLIISNDSGTTNWAVGPSSGGSTQFYVSAGAGVYLSSTSATSWTANSDERLKNITGKIENALDAISTLTPAKFTWKSDETNTPQVGLIAQEVEKVLPEVVDKNADGYLGVRYTETIPLLVAAIQEQQTIINNLKARIETLEAKK